MQWLESEIVTEESDNVGGGIVVVKIGVLDHAPKKTDTPRVSPTTHEIL